MEKDRDTTVAENMAEGEGAVVPTEPVAVAAVLEARGLAQAGDVSVEAAATRNLTSRGSPATRRPVPSAERR